MPKVLYCTFCKRPVKPGSGIAYVRNDGAILHFCSSKCFKSSIKMHRDPRKLKWAKASK
ncbi:MAG: 50S ribosomal protein L24e [Thermofilum sp.]|uniref:Large ribosomal subunit protein eL24 n=1 Tax=Thermofilum pendens TaxID=2269 RepID=A0A7C4H4H6_THEPE